ncbi:MAG: hypothetical protein ABI723_18760 [Bacteroidia bacterium]
MIFQRCAFIFLFSSILHFVSFTQTISTVIEFYRGTKDTGSIITSIGNKKNMVYFYQDGIKNWENNLDGNKPNGLNAVWNEMGKLIYLSYFTDSLPDKKWAKWFPTGIKEYEKNYTIIYVEGQPKSVLNGIYMENYSNGSPKTRANYILGKKDGLYQTWFENGFRKERIDYKEGFNSGKEEYWYENGKKESIRTYIIIKDSIGKKSVLNGLFIRYYSNGLKRDRSNYINGHREGLYKIWFETGQINNVYHLKNGYDNGKRKLWYSNGIFAGEESLYGYKDSIYGTRMKYNGKYITNHQNGKPKERYQFKNGLKNGVQVDYHYNGRKNTVSFYKDNLQTGLQVIYYTNGKVNDSTRYEIINRNDSIISVKQGYYVKYYDTGEMWETYNYKNDLREGAYKSYFKNGKLSEDCIYQEGLKTGLSTIYNDNGSVRETNIYKIVIDETGNKISVPSK